MDEIKDLQEEIEKLKEEKEINAKRDLHHQLILHNYFHKKTDSVEGITFNQQIVNYCEKLKAENEKLKSIIKETKRSIGYSVSDSDEEGESDEEETQDETIFIRKFDLKNK
jgi:hypothetical protein